MNSTNVPTTSVGPDVLLGTVAGLAIAAEQAELVHIALSSGILTGCVTPITTVELADQLRLTPVRTAAICDALHAMGALERTRDRFLLSPTWAPLASGGVHVTVERMLSGSAAWRKLLASTPSGANDYWAIDAQQRRAVADSVTLATTTEFGPAVLSAVYATVPEIEDDLRAGARWLELGCGVAGMALGMLRAYPDVTVVGVDLAEDLLQEARKRARALGVERRISFVRADAATFDDGTSFDIAFWSQYFFPAATRRPTLANVFERLRPGGILLCPFLNGDPESYASGSPSAQQAALHAIVLTDWVVPILSGDELADELSTAGFLVKRISRGSFPIVLAERPEWTGSARPIPPDACA